MVGPAVPLPAAVFPQFGVQHLVILGTCVAGAALLLWLARTLRGSRREVLLRRSLAAVLVCFAVPLQAWQLTGKGWDFYTSLPLQLTDLDWVVAVWALVTLGWRSRALLYYWGLTLTPQAIITPELSFLWPHPAFVGFWGVHLFTFWSATYLTAAARPGPDWRGYRWALLCTTVWAVLVMGFNALAGTNYGFLNRKPQTASALDLLGPWPLYVLAEVVIIVVAWALITWPWVARHQPSR